MDRIDLFSPATIANVSCGFDVLGLALEGIGDTMSVQRVETPGLRIVGITGQPLSRQIENNVAGVAARALYRAVDIDAGFELRMDKRIKPGSGIGSSAASAAGAVWGLNELLGRPFTTEELIPFAMEGEALAGGTAHADNVAPALLGGFVLVRSYEPLDIVPLPCPEELHAVVLHPQIEMRTADSRAVLREKIELRQGVRQWGNLAGLVAGLFREDYALIGRSLEDHVVEPVRGLLIPGFEDLKAAAERAGALGSGISGSGPSVFALARGRESAQAVAAAMGDTYEPLGVPHEIHVSRVDPRGVRALDPKPAG